VRRWLALGALSLVATACSSGGASTATTGLSATTATVTQPATTTTAATRTTTSTTTSTSTTTAATTATTAPPTSSAAPSTTTVMLPGSTTVRSMSWPTATDGWVLGERDGTAVLLRTGDGGASWTASTGPDLGNAIQVLFADTANGWVAGENELRSTHDGGTSWAVVSLPGGATTGVAAAAAGATVHVATAGGATVGVASSSIDHDAFVAAPVTIAYGAGPRLDVAMSAGGAYGELIYSDRTFIGAAEIRDGQWATWDLACPFANPAVVAGLSPQGKALAIACGPSGFGDAAPVLGANLSTATLTWTTIEPADDPSQAQPIVDFATATDAGVRIVVFTTSGGTGEITSSTDAGATWPTRTALPAGTSPSAIAHLPDGSVLLALEPSGGLISHDGLTWTAVATTT
jgi:hypothetical protein